MRWVLPLLLAPVVAMAQEPPREPAALRALALALQQMAVASEQYIAETRAERAARDARIAELLKLCGEACK